MRILKDNDIKLIEYLAKSKQHILSRSLYEYLLTIYDKDKVVFTKNYVYAQGTVPIALVAHMDTVFKTPPTDIYYDRQKGVMWSPQGLGADDRAGIFIILKILKTTGLRPYIIFTADEEIGGIGATNFVKDYKEPPTDLKYIIQLDRQGTNDCVFYDCENDEFTQYCESFGFTEAIGSFSDISEICPAWGIAGVNFSVGYFNEHSYVETLHIAPLMATLEKVIKMLKDADNAAKFEWLPSAYMRKYYMYNALNGKWTDPLDYYGINEKGYSMYGYPLEDDDYTMQCEVCGRPYSEYEMFPVLEKEGKKIRYYCPDCIVGNVEWCETCGEAFEIDPAKPDLKICPDCRSGKGAQRKRTWKTESKKSNINSSKSSDTHKK